MLKLLLFILLILLTIYAPIELTRVILVWGLGGGLITELAIMWGAYLMAFILLVIIWVKGLLN